MKYNMDLHIHSVLSPCADLLMTLENIISKLKEMDIKIFSITDHNSAKNIKVFMERAEKEKMILIPGMEIQTAEEIHILVYFDNIEKLLTLQDLVYKSLPKYKNNEEIYGYQLIIDENDEFIEKEEKFLTGSIEIGVDELFGIVKELGGIFIPAHIDRSNSIIENLGYVPELDFDAFEIYNINKIKHIKEKYKLKKQIVSSSDAHFINCIEIPKMYVELEELNLKNVFRSIKDGLIKFNSNKKN